MQSKYIHIYQFFSWALVLATIVGSLAASRGLAPKELNFAIVLIGSTALYSYIIRAVFKAKLQSFSTLIQSIYFLIQSILGAVLATVLMIATIVLFSELALITQIPDEALSFMITSAFWGNFFNMFGALIFWSFAYLLIIKLRLLYATKEALASTQLEVLSQQLNPHFLFNTLNNIRASILEEPSKARDSLAQLADMLRYTLQEHQDSKVPLRDELKVVDEYLSLCRIQYEDRLAYTADVDETLLTSLVPKLLLQLLVENAIKHGIAQLKKGGTINLNISRQENHVLFISISNPVSRQPKKIDMSNNAGIGLTNIRKRLKLLYPNLRTNLPSLSLSLPREASDFSQADTAIASIELRLPLEFETANVQPHSFLNSEDNESSHH